MTNSNKETIFKKMLRISTACYSGEIKPHEYYEMIDDINIKISNTQYAWGLIKEFPKMGIYIMPNNNMCAYNEVLIWCTAQLRVSSISDELDFNPLNRKQITNVIYPFKAIISVIDNSLPEFEINMLTDYPEKIQVTDKTEVIFDLEILKRVIRSVMNIEM